MNKFITDENQTLALLKPFFLLDLPTECQDTGELCEYFPLYAYHSVWNPDRLIDKTIVETIDTHSSHGLGSTNI